MTPTTNWKLLARDVLIVFALMNLGGLLVGFTTGILLGPDAIYGPKAQAALAFSNVVCGILAFSIIGTLKRVDRFKHLLAVAAINWLLALPNLLFLPFTLKYVLAAPAYLLIAMVFGLGLSFLFVRPPRTSNQLRSN